MGTYVSYVHTSQSSICSHMHYQLWKKFLAPGWQILLMSCTACICMGKVFASPKCLATSTQPLKSRAWSVLHPVSATMSQSHSKGCIHFKACLSAAQSSNPLTYWHRQNFCASLRTQACPCIHSLILINPISWSNPWHTPAGQGSKGPWIHPSSLPMKVLAELILKAAYIGYSAIRRSWIPSTWTRLHGLREADSPKFDLARVYGAKALPKWRYQSKDLTCIILKLSTPSSWKGVRIHLLWGGHVSSEPWLKLYGCCRNIMVGTGIYSQVSNRQSSV